MLPAVREKINNMFAIYNSISIRELSTVQLIALCSCDGPCMLTKKCFSISFCIYTLPVDHADVLSL